MRSDFNIPDTIHVGGFTYSVVQFNEPIRYVMVDPDNPSESQEVVCGGRCLVEEGIIQLWVGDRLRDRVWIDLWHEILHAIDVAADGNMSEHEVTVFAPILATVIGLMLPSDVQVRTAWTAYPLEPGLTV